MEVGLSYIVAAKATEANGVTAYSSGTELAEAVDANIDIKIERKKFYSNDKVRATRKKFKEGSLKLGLDDLSQSGRVLLFGGTESSAGITGDTSTKELAEGGDDTYNPVGIGFVGTKMVGNDVMYRAIWLRHVEFDPPVEDLKTEGESIEYKNPSITGSIYEAVVTSGGAMKYKDEVTVDTIAKAKAWLNGKAGIS